MSNCSLSSSLTRLAPVALLGIAVSDVVFYYGWTSGLAGVGAWFFLHILMVGFAVSLIGPLLCPAGIPALIALLITYGVLTALVLDPQNLSHEVTQQAACALQQLSQEHYGFQQNCFLGYPARGYYLTALPSLLFGASEHALLSGNALVLGLGATLFICGIFEAGDRTFQSSLVACAAVVALYHVYYVREFVPLFEQTILPLAYSLALTGSALVAYKRRDTLAIWMCGLIGYGAAFLYTPALSLSAFVVVCSCLAALIDCSRRGPWILIAISIIVASAISLKFRGDIRVGSGFSVIGERLAEAWSALVTDRDRLGNDALLVLIGVSAVLPTLLLPRLSWRWIVVTLGLCGWAITTTAVSVLMGGYAAPTPTLSIHRAMIVVPPILALGGLAFCLMSRGRVSTIGASLVLLTIGVASASLNFPSARPDPHWTFVKDLRNHALHEKELKIVFDENLKGTLLSLADISVYFAPRLQYYFLPDHPPLEQS